MKPKRLISLLVAVCMMITMLPLSAVTAFAADTSTVHEANDGEGIYRYAYKENEDGETVTITDFLGPVDSTKTSAPYTITVPTKLGNYKVTGLGEYSFSAIPYSADHDKDSTLRSFCNQIQSVTIPESVTSIGNGAFAYCSALGNVTIPQSITSIGKEAFDHCSGLKLTTPSFGEKLQTIGEHAFRNCGLREVTIPQSVTSIGYGAFSGCRGLRSLTINDAATSIGGYAFNDCSALTTLKLGEHITTIGNGAFENCNSLDNVTIPQSVTSIGNDAFNYCYMLSTITIPEKVEKIGSGTFYYCKHLKSITLPAGLKYFEASLDDCPADCVIYYNNDETHAHDLFGDKLVGDKLAGHKFLCLCNVTFDANGGTLTDKGGNPTDHAVVSAYKTQNINADDLKAIPNPTRAGYNFTGWYTKDGTSLNVNDIITKAMTKDITFYARWELAPKAPVYHPLTLKDGVITSVTVPGKDGADPEDITEIVKKNANEDGSFHVPEGATVSVAFDKDAFADSGLKFGHWDITGLDDPNAYQDKESFAFEMPAKAVTLKAMTQDASIEDDEPNVLGTAAIIGTAAVGTAVLGYQAYSLGAEFAGKLMALPYFPSNRSALAMMLWEDAGKPMPESELLYPDVEQEAQDMDLQHAARWAMENELIPDLNDEGTAPEEMKFFPANPVSKLDVLNAWQKAQELKNN